MKLDITREGNPNRVSIEVSGDTRIGDIIKRHLSEFANASDHYQDLEAYVENGNDELSKDDTVASIGLKNGDAIHFSRCDKVNVIVHHDNNKVSLEGLSPAFTLKKVERRLIKAFDLDVNSKQLELRISGQDEILSEKAHLGSLTTYPICTVELEIVPTLVVIKIKTDEYKIEPGEYLVSKLKALANIGADFKLVQIINGNICPLEDHAKVVIKGGELFNCQARGGKSS